MNDNINFKDLWAGQTAGQPDTNDLFLQINKLKKANLKKLIVTNILLVLTSVFIVSVWFFYQPQLMTTKTGIILIILAMVVYLFAYNQSYSILKAETRTRSNSEYLKNLLAIKTKQQFLNTTMLNIYFVMLSSGIGLYMYEYASRMTAFWAIFTYGITSIWVLFNWLFIRPRQIKKQQHKLDEIISEFEMLNKQLDE